jgi:hypothetical protein
MHGSGGSGARTALRICRGAVYTSVVLLFSPDHPQIGSPDVQRHLLSTATVARRGATMTSSSSSSAAAAAAVESKLFPRSEARSHNLGNRWTTRIIPVILLAIIGFACWALTKPICSESDPARARAVQPTTCPSGTRDMRTKLTRSIASTQLTSLSLEVGRAVRSPFLSFITSS